VTDLEKAEHELKLAEGRLRRYLEAPDYTEQVVGDFLAEKVDRASNAVRRLKAEAA